MEDTAQLAGAAETDLSVAEAASAFKAFTSEQPVQPRDELGRFATPEEELAEAESEAPDDADPAESGEYGDVEADEDEAEAAEEAQPLPPSWPADKADIWDALPAEGKAFIAERDAEQLRQTNAKLQESANARKAAEAAQAEANANRTQYAEAIDLVISAIAPIKPDPRAFGAGTGQYMAEAYELAKSDYETQVMAISQLQQQRLAVQEQVKQEQDAQFMALKQEREAIYAPRFVADMPELTDPVRAGPALQELINYAIAEGIPPETFAPENQRLIDSAELHILWKAQQFDKLNRSVAAPKPKPAGPAIRPGVSSPRSATRNAQGARAMDRLAREGSVEAGAAMFKHLLTGTR